MAPALHESDELSTIRLSLESLRSTIQAQDVSLARMEAALRGVESSLADGKDKHAQIDDLRMKIAGMEARASIIYAILGVVGTATIAEMIAIVVMFTIGRP